MLIISQIAFALIVIVGVAFFSWNIYKIRRNIMLGKKLGNLDNKDIRWRRVILNALGQKKMFKRPLPAVLHLFLYVGFVIINIEILEIVLDGLFGSHRLFAPFMGNLYAPFISFFEFLAVAVLISCIIFLFRRNVYKVKRLNSYELAKWPRLDANIILFTEIGLMSAFLIMNAADLTLQSRYNPHYAETGSFFFSNLLVPLFNGMSDNSLVYVERLGWWAHIIGIFAFMNYLPYSKHLHIFFVFPNSFYAKLPSMGEMRNMPEIENEVKLMMDPSAAQGEAPPPPEKFGANDIQDLHWNDLLGAYACTECGRCTAECPANITGKLLSPRKIMMDTRDRCEDLGKGIQQHGPDFKDNKTLLGNYITHEEIMACTTCQACVEACPVNINPLSIIQELRRYIIMDEAKSPASWNVMFNNIENNMAPWQFSPADRDKWTKEMG